MEHTKLTGRLDTVESGIERLLDAIAEGESSAVTRRLMNLEAEREELRAKLRELREQIDDSHHEFVARRLGLLMEALMKYERVGRAEGGGLVLQEANARLRETLKAVTVDYNRGVLCFDWKHGGASEIGFAETHTNSGKLRPLLPEKAPNS